MLFFACRSTRITRMSETDVFNGVPVPVLHYSTNWICVLAQYHPSDLRLFIEKQPNARRKWD